jgi:methylenetetrahydrofolate dehydrogenase (NADP+)/methenyltetrahydrofolate cyclohydrolase
VDVLVHGGAGFRGASPSTIVPLFMAELIKGAPIAAGIEESVRKELAEHPEKARPHLVAVRAVADPASDAYLRRQAQAAERVGLRYSIEQVPEGAGEARLIEAIGKLNAEPSVTGIIVQLPLPPGTRVETVQKALDPLKDVEGVHPTNLGALLGDAPRLVPCTAAAVMACLEATGRDPAGMNAVVVGRSRIVGRPVALLLVQKNATVTVCHRQTRDQAGHLLRADLVVMAAGQAGLLKPSMVKPGCIVIDVGTNEVVRDGKRGLAGDADPEVAGVAGWFTPVPGGVGPVTVALLWRNAVEAWKLQRPS